MTRSRLKRFCPLALFVFFLASSLLPVIARASEAARARIPGTIDESSLVTLSGNIHPLAQPAFDQGPAAVDMSAGRLTLVLQRSAQQEADLRTWLQSTQDPNSAGFRNWLTPEQFGTRFGVSDADLASVQSWLQSHGFTINRVAKGRTSIEFSGTVGQVQAAFHTSLHRYTVNGETHWANATNPQIPTALSPVVAGIARLNNFSPRAQFIRAPSGVYNATTRRIEPTYTLGNATNGYTIYLGPADAATVYDLPTSLNPNLSGTAYDGTGVTIGIAGDSNIDIGQNANYRATFGLSAKATSVVVDGADPGENGDAIEAYLDTQVSTGIAPNANIVLYTAADTYFNAGLFLAIDRAIDDNQVDILNVSFGGCEAAQGTSGNQYIYALWQQAAAQGISVTVSSGDSGSAGCDNDNTETVAKYGLAVNGLASTPYNIAVGGTDFDTLFSNFPTSFTTYVNVSNTLPNHRSALKYIPEKPWNDSTFQNDNTTLSVNIPWTAYSQYSSNANIVAAGGGVSSCSTSTTTACTAGYTVPTWQSGFATDKSGRNVPDVSLLAGNGLYGATWGLCTDMDYDQYGNHLADCSGTPTTGASFNLTGVGGTSASAPAMAGILALVRQKVGSRLGQADYVLYDLAKSKYSTVFHDVTAGNNSVACSSGTSGCAANADSYYFMTGYNATTGYDEASGLGSVDVSQLVSNWSSAGLTTTTSSLTLNGGTSALTLTHGAQVMVNVGVSAGGATATGDIALVDNINPATLPNNDALGSVSLLGGSATGITNSLPGGSYNISAHYGGSSTLAGSDSNSIPVTVSPESSSIALKVSGYYDPVTGKALANPYYGSIFLLDAQPYGKSASASNPDGSATGTITFLSGTSTLGTAMLASDGIAELQTQVLPGGVNSLTASFPGDASYNASTSAPVSFTVVPDPTQASLTSILPFAPSVGQSVTMIASITTTFGSGAPTGTVVFYSGSTKLGTVPLVGTAATSQLSPSGTATFTTANLPTGTDNITAVYSGDGNYSGSTTSAITVTVGKASTSLTVTPSPSTIQTNQALQVTVTPAAVTGLPVPTGAVTLSYSESGTSVQGTMSAVNLVSGVATITIPANTFSAGDVLLTANYGGDSNYSALSNTVWVTISPSGTIKPTVSLVAPATPVSPAQDLVSVTVTGPNGDPVATGSVLLFSQNYYSNRNALVNGTATFSMGTANGNYPAGGLTFTASYTGDSNYASGSATGLVYFQAYSNLSFTPASPAVVVNQPVTITVNAATSTSFAAPTGTVTLSGSGYNSSAVTLVNGAASFTIPANTLPVGADILFANYSGDANYKTSSNGVTVNVSAVPTPGIALSGTALTLTHGATTGNTSTITVTPSNGFTGSVALTAAILNEPTGASDPPTLSFGATTPVTISGNTAGTATLTVTTTPTTTTANAVRDMEHASRGAGWIPAGGLTLACLILLIRPSQRRKWQTLLGLLVFCAALAGGVFACGGGGGSSNSGGGGGGTTTNTGTTAGNYTVTITGTSGTLTATTTVVITVN